ncbi:MAG TPA: hypothetical protein EYQ78_08375 [Candidatus Poseidoniales archaeon]|nr:hypothetical protein [Candidatus Poseidoniales archaeon]
MPELNSFRGAGTAITNRFTAAEPSITDDRATGADASVAVNGAMVDGLIPWGAAAAAGAWG